MRPPGYAHSDPFADLALARSAGFAEAGGSAPLAHAPADWGDRLPIVLGANLLPHSVGTSLPAGSLLYNLEQGDTTGPWLTPAYRAWLDAYPVLDYSQRNAGCLAALGLPVAGVLEPGYSPALRRLTPAAEPVIDVLFYGSVNPRRRALLAALEAAGLRVRHLFGVYGAERDRAIELSRLVLNLHFYETAVFEIVRVVFLLANAIPVVSEGDPGDPDIGALAPGLALAPYDGLVARCVALCRDRAARQALGRRGFELIARRPQAAALRRLFER